jgi:hypothetical protein
VLFVARRKFLGDGWKMKLIARRKVEARITGLRAEG